MFAGYQKVADGALARIDLLNIIKKIYISVLEKIFADAEIIDDFYDAEIDELLSEFIEFLKAVHVAVLHSFGQADNVLQVFSHKYLHL